MTSQDTANRLNLANPLAEPTRARRLMAAYRQRGFTRQTFAEALGVAYSTLRAWDLGIHTMPLDRFERACALVDYTAAELSTGERMPAAREPHLATDEAIRAALDELNASPAARAGFAEHIASPAGRYQTVTRSYLAGFVAAYEHSRAHAPAHAINEQVDHALARAGLGGVTQDEMTAFIRRLVAERRDGR